MSRSKVVRILLVALVLAVAYGVAHFTGAPATPTGDARPVPAPAAPAADAPEGSVVAARSGDADIAAAFREQRSGLMVESVATVDRLLADDQEGSRHQRFVIRLASGQTVLVAHNIDLAPRVPLAVGDEVAFRGQYEWNDRGGVIHWTHHDPAGRHPGGWLHHEGRRYE